MGDSEKKITEVYCELPHCVYKDGERCTAPIVELLFGIVIKLPGQGTSGFQRCAQYTTVKDLERKKTNISSRS